jgi:hypothetical protein
MSHPLSQFKVQAKPKGGAPLGNRNALKHGTFTGRSLANRNASRRKTQQLIRESEEILALALAMAARRDLADTLPRKGAIDRD